MRARMAAGVFSPAAPREGPACESGTEQAQRRNGAKLVAGGGRGGKADAAIPSRSINGHGGLRYGENPQRLCTGRQNYNAFAEGKASGFRSTGVDAGEMRKRAEFPGCG